MNDHDTGYHDHDLSAGAVAVTAGAVREERLVLGGAPAARTVSTGGSFTFGPADIHRVSHAGSEPAVTLHAYSPPLWRMGSYEGRAAPLVALLRRRAAPDRRGEPCAFGARVLGKRKDPLA
jgi:hypothetical protein